MVKCPPNYKNLNEIQSFSEQVYPTIQWAEQNCENDEYLKQEVDELNYRSPARIRKRWKPILVDDTNSYGYILNPNNVVTFSDVVNTSFIVDFSDFSQIDMERSDCAFITYTDGNDVEHQCATVPMEQTSTVNLDCANMDEKTQINSYWYCGFDKTKPYQIRPDWIKDWKDNEIPSVARAQTFTIPEGIENGHLESVDVPIQNNGTIISNWGSPLYVQIRKVKYKKREKKKWDKKKKKAVSYSPKQWEWLASPVGGNARNSIATCEFNPDIITPGFQNFRFDKEIIVNSGEQYALVFLSPLSHWDHCPRIGGWGLNCSHHKYEGGDAFLSESNGRAWGRYGKNDDSLNYSQYKLGLYTPQDFGFQFHIREYENGYDTDEDFYLYLKPIHLNPIKSIQLVPQGYGSEAQLTDLNLEFQVSPSGRANSWVTLNANDLSIQFNPDQSTGEYPHFAYIRVKMSTSDSSDAPYLDSLKVIVEMDSPREMYVRTQKYNPKISPMLGASAWSKFFSDFELDPNVKGSVEIIKEQVVKEHFDIITAAELDDYTYIDGLDVLKITDESLDVRYNYLMTDSNALKLLRANKVYVKPYTYEDNSETVTHPMSFSEGIQFDNSPAYPIVRGMLEPSGNEPSIAISEWIDYKFDYDNDILTFNNVLNQYTNGNDVITEGIEEYLPTGVLEITYQPIFIQDLTNKDVGIREDSEGFILDYFKEETIINEQDIENRYIQLKFEPCDPIRELVIDDVEYIEDIHFTVDYLNNRIEFPIIDVNASATLLNDNLGKDMYIVYTPNLDDAGLILGYRGIRTDTSQQMKIKENYIEYKV